MTPPQRPASARSDPPKPGRLPDNTVLFEADGRGW